MKENGKRQTINSMKYHAEQIQEKLHIYFKYHFLRHTYGTALADRNTPVHILCNQMGHASVTFYAMIISHNRWNFNDSVHLHI